MVDFMAWRSALGISYREVDLLLYGGAWLEKISKAEQTQIGGLCAPCPIRLKWRRRSGWWGWGTPDYPFDDWTAMQQVRCSSVESTSKLAECCLWSTERFEHSTRIRSETSARWFTAT